MTFGYFVPAPTLIPVGLPALTKKRKPAKPASKPAKAKPAA